MCAKVRLQLSAAFHQFAHPATCAISIALLVSILAGCSAVRDSAGDLASAATTTTSALVDPVRTGGEALLAPARVAAAPLTDAASNATGDLRRGLASPALRDHDLLRAGIDPELQERALRGGLSGSLARARLKVAEHLGKHKMGHAGSFAGVAAVVERPTVRVEGYVFRPGPVVIPSAGLTLAEALKQAGGPYVARHPAEAALDDAVASLDKGFTVSIAKPGGSTEKNVVKNVSPSEDAMTLRPTNRSYKLSVSDLLVALRREGPAGESTTYFALPLVQLYAAGGINLRESDYVRVVDWRSTTLGDDDPRQTGQVLDAFRAYMADPSSITPEILPELTRTYARYDSAGALVQETTRWEPNTDLRRILVKEDVLVTDVTLTDRVASITRLNPETNETETFVLPVVGDEQSAGATGTFPNYNFDMLVERLIFDGDVLGLLPLEQLPLIVADRLTTAVASGQTLSAAQLQALAEAGVLGRLGSDPTQLNPADFGLSNIPGLTMPSLAVPIRP